MATDYDVRRFRPGDREGYLSLYRSVMGSPGTEAWFEWKYVANPYTDEIPIHVVEHDGEIVGARASFVLPLTDGTETYRGVQASDVMVRPEHQRRGLHTELARVGRSYARATDTDVLFGFPNQNSYPNAIRSGYVDVLRLPFAVRFDDVRPIARRVTGDRLAGPLAGALRPAWRVATAVRDRAGRSGLDRRIAVERSETWPVDALCELERTSPSSGFQLLRDRRFYAWRYRKPTRTYECYLARVDGTPRAAVIARVERDRPTPRIDLVDVLPRRSGPSAAVEAAVRTLLADHADVWTVRTLATPHHRAVFDRLGFWRADAFPFSLVAARNKAMVVYPLNGSLRDRLVSPDAWNVSLVEWDVA